MSIFTIEKYGDTQYQLQCTSESGFGTHIIFTADELAQLRELLAPMAWEAKPSGEGKYVRMPLPHLPYIVSFVDVWDYCGELLANGEGDTAKPVEELGGLWLKLPDVPEGKKGNTK